MKCKISVPYNIVDYGGGLVGLDAYFWDSVELPQRRMLLVVPAENLSNTPSGARLEPHIDASKQIGDVHSIAAGEWLQKRRRSAIRLFSLRFASLFVPGRYVLDELEKELSATDYFSYKLAQNIARKLKYAKPTGRIGWLDFEASEDIRGIALKCSFNPAGRIYSNLLVMDHSFKAAIVRAIRRLC